MTSTSTDDVDPNQTTDRTTARGYVLRHPWPADCAVQSGGHGLVLGPTTRITAFFEAFPSEPKTFIRGEGATVEDAEDAAWARWVRVSAGDHEHRWETRGYRNGAGFCAECGLFASGVFDLAEIGSVCEVCGVGTYWSEVDGKLYCQEHAPSLLEELASARRAVAEGHGSLMKVAMLEARVLSQEYAARRGADSDD